MSGSGSRSGSGSASGSRTFVNRTTRTRVSRLVLRYLGLVEGPQDRLLRVGGTQVHPNRWMIVATAVQNVMGANYDFKLAFDPRNNKCYMLCRTVADADYLNRRLFFINEPANNQEACDTVFFSPVRNLYLYEESIDEGVQMTIRRVT